MTLAHHPNHDDPVLVRAVDLARLALAFSRVERVTRHEDGVRPETDSDHTVMLAVVACDLAQDIAPDLDRGLIAQFAIVHDLLEADLGDVQTLTLDDAGREAKADRERAAMQRFRERYGAESWVVRTLTEYERQRTDEAQYVRVLDKVLPKLTHLLNGCVAAKGLTDHDGFVASHRAQWRRLREEYPSSLLTPLFALLMRSMDASEAAWSPS